MVHTVVCFTAVLNPHQRPVKEFSVHPLVGEKNYRYSGFTHPTLHLMQGALFLRIIKTIGENPRPGRRWLAAKTHHLNWYVFIANLKVLIHRFYGIMGE